MNNSHKIWGILNVTPDSFSDGGNNFNDDAAIDAAIKLMLDGADVLDIGAESTRPDATLISANQEWSRIKNILPIIKQEAKKHNVLISLDSSKGTIIEKALDYIDIINDVSALSDPATIAIVKESKLPCVLMHHLTIPANREIVMSDQLDELDVLEQISAWFNQKLEIFQELGIPKNQFILDPGIGFGKAYNQSMTILKQISKLRQFNLPIVVGHSRKRYLQMFNASNLQNLDIYTALISLHLLKSKIEHIRVHNVLMHKQFINIQNSLTSEL
jgi:dihydropteroate synthase